MKVEIGELQALAEADPRKVAARARDVRRFERRAQAVELRKAGLTFHSIGLALGCTEANAHKLVKAALRSAVRTPADALIEQSLRDLELCWTKTLAILNAIHPLVSGGGVVYDVVRDAKGDPIIDPRTNEPLRLPLSDAAPVLKAIERLQSLSESKRKLLGIDKPQQLHLTTDGDPMRTVSAMDQTRLEQALQIGLSRLRRPATDVVDATVVSEARSGGIDGGSAGGTVRVGSGE